MPSCAGAFAKSGVLLGHSSFSQTARFKISFLLISSITIGQDGLSVVKVAHFGFAGLATRSLYILDLTKRTSMFAKLNIVQFMHYLTTWESLIGHSRWALPHYTEMGHSSSSF